MTHEEIIAMANSAAAQHGHTYEPEPADGTVEFLAIFASLVAAKERSECAQVCDAERQDFGGVAAGPMTTDAGKRVYEAMAAGAATCAAAIRARGQKEGV